MKKESESALDKVLLGPIIEKPPVIDKVPRSEAVLRKTEKCVIKINNTEDKWHITHPVNVAIRLINQFAIEAFLKQSQSFFIHKKKDSVTSKPAQYHLSTQTQSSTSVPAPVSGLDMKVIQQLAD